MPSKTGETFGFEEIEIDPSKRFNLHTIIGMSGSGKTRLLTYLISEFWKIKEIDYCILFSGTDFDPANYPFVKPHFVLPVTLEGVLSAINKIRELGAKGK